LTYPERLTTFVVDAVEALERTHLPGFRMPRVFGGHEVGTDARADLVFTLGLLGECGVESIAGRPIDDALRTALAAVDGRRTNTFFSYRIAETLLRRPHLLAEADDATREQLLLACDSTAFLAPMADGRLPRNYAAVLLRCEVDRERLGLDPDPAVLADLTDRVRALLGTNPRGYLDDSHTAIARYDIYSGDIYLFTEPFADRLGDVWRDGARHALDLVDRIAAPNGAAFSWGRSSGALATCLTVELGGLAASHPLLDDEATARWLARSAHAFDRTARWFAGDGVITAHQHRSTFGYRGPFRRLQMTLDCLGKLADTAAVLRRVGVVDAPVVDDLFPDRDELLVLDEPKRAGVWTYRSHDLAFVLPIVGGTVSDYLPTPHEPGLFEVPVDAELATGVPVAFRRGVRHVGGHLPVELDKGDGSLRLRYEGFVAAGQLEVGPDTAVLEGTRAVTYRVEGRTLHVDEELTFADDAVPHALAVQVVETKDRPLRVRFRGDGEPTVIDVDGLKEYRSFWAELPRVHQLDLVPSTRVAFGWSVTPVLRVLTSTVTSHHYQRAVYDPLVAAGAVVDRTVSQGRLLGDATYLDAWDLFHLHWPEWFLGPDLARHEAAIDALRSSGVRIVWTQHNLVPHDKDRRQEAIYAAWAAAADGVVHHSRYGEARVRATLPFREDAVHAVIPHVHFGGSVAAARGDRDGPVRLGIVGAPRREKDVQGAMDAFARVRRDDVELHVWSLGPDDVVPADPRIVTAEPYAMVDRTVYDARLAGLDALVLPFAEGDMITTGTAGDVIGGGLAALVSDWGYLREALGEAGIAYGSDLAAAVDALDREALARAASAARALQAGCDPAAVAAAHLRLFERIGTSRL
jgi:glycosyltransferase involved in cell wall biosynthesis